MSGGVVGAVDIATLSYVRHPREVPFAGLPLLFGVRQRIEAGVWLALDGHISRTAGDIAAYVYVLNAQGVLPILVPLAVLLIEPSPRRRAIIFPVLLTGLAAGICLFWIDVAHLVRYQIINHGIA